MDFSFDETHEALRETMRRHAAQELAPLAREATRWLVYPGAWCVDRGCLTSAHAAKVKLIATEAAVRVSQNAVRVLGGAGSMREYSVGRNHHDALGYVNGEGTSDIQRHLIARDLRS